MLCCGGRAANDSPHFVGICSPRSNVHVWITMNFKMIELKRCILLSALLTAAALRSSLYRLATDGPQVECKSVKLCYCQHCWKRKLKPQQQLLLPWKKYHFSVKNQTAVNSAPLSASLFEHEKCLNRPNRIQETRSLAEPNSCRFITHRIYYTYINRILLFSKLRDHFMKSSVTTGRVIGQ